ncbi:MAG: hypothetical protein AB7E47_15655 [Desulfovibrionaceae bacterium]
MSEHKESELPLSLAHGEVLYLDGGGSIRWESNGEAKDVFFGDSFERDTEIFPGNEYEYVYQGRTFRLKADFGDDLLIEKV